MNDFPAYIDFMCKKFEDAGGLLPWPKKVMAVLLRDEFTCHYCGEIRLAMTADHMLPQCRGGSSDMSNLVCACEDCNRSKSSRTKEEFIAVANTQRHSAIKRNSIQMEVA